MTESLVVDQVIGFEEGKGITASGRIPKTAEFFQDHFPQFPILPGVLALELLKKTMDCYAKVSQKKSKGPCTLKQVRAVKFSSYLKPGDEWESQMRLVSEQDGTSEWQGELRHAGQTAVSARFAFQTQEALENLTCS